MTPSPAASEPSDVEASDVEASDAEASGADAYCTGCGRPVATCTGCGRALDPPRFCPACGRRMAVSVIPTGWTARCRDHPDLVLRSA